MYGFEGVARAPLENWRHHLMKKYNALERNGSDNLALDALTEIHSPERIACFQRLAAANQ